MNILQVTLDLSRAATGVAVTVEGFNLALRRLGHRVNCISFDRRCYQAEERPVYIQRVPCVRLPFITRYAFSPLAMTGRYDALIKQADAVFIHALYGHHFTWTIGKCRKHRKPCFVIPHGALTDYCLSRRTLIKQLWLRRVSGQLARAVLVCSSKFEATEALHHATPGRVVTMYWPIPTPHPVSLAQLRRFDPPTLLLAGRLHPVKRTLETVRSFRRLGLAGWQLCLAGLPSPEVTPANLRAAAGEQWGKSIHYLGNLTTTDLARWYRSSAGAVLFSRGDSFSHVVADALLHGCPAYVSREVGLADLITENGFGETFSIHGEHDIEQALAKIMTRGSRVDEDWSLRMSNTCASLFSPEVFEHRLEGLLQSVKTGSEPSTTLRNESSS